MVMYGSDSHSASDCRLMLGAVLGGGQKAKPQALLVFLHIAET